MPRVKRGTVRRAKRKRLLSRAKGYFLTKSKLYRSAQQAVDKALGYAFVGRRNKKRDFRRLWIVRINAAARENNFTYRQLIQGLKLANIEIDRKQLAEMAVADAPAFTAVVDQARKAVETAAKA
jgi:large subunit ribosomal protein L20